MAVIGCVRNPQAHTAEECAKCDFKNGQCNSYRHAEALYNAGYCKTFTSDLASDTQKAYKEGYDKGFLDGREEFDIILQQNKQLLQAREISKSDIERLKTQLQQANAGIVNCSGCYLVELNAVKEFAEKLKAKAFNKDMFNDWAGATYVVLVREIDKLLKGYESG